MLGMGTVRKKRTPDFDIGQAVTFTVYFGYGCTEFSGEVVEHTGAIEYVVQSSNGGKFVVRVGKDGNLTLGGPN